MDDVTEQRRVLRASGRVARAGVTGASRTAATRAITASLLGLPEVVAATRVLVTFAVGDELDLSALRTALREHGTTVALPVVRGEDLVAVDWDVDQPMRRGWRGVPEPTGRASPAPPDVVIVPALVLDRRGGRLGYGGGHFDRFLAGQARRATAVGAVFDEQLVANVPLQPHDVVLDVVVTQRGVWRDGHSVG